MFDTRWSSDDTPLSPQHRGNVAGIYQNIERRFNVYGVQNVLITAIPLPGRDMSKLVLHQRWGKEPFTTIQLAQIRGNDCLLRQLAVSQHPLRWQPNGADSESLVNSPLFNLLRRHAGDADATASLIGIHILLDQLQLGILLSGSDINISDIDLRNVTNVIAHELADIHQEKALLPTRPGELSTREKMVLSKTAEGKTAGDIAIELDISQRTVHAHLQNASEKMQAANKTQTVVEALRYGQIRLS